MQPLGQIVQQPQRKLVRLCHLRSSTDWPMATTSPQNVCGNMHEAACCRRLKATPSHLLRVQLTTIRLPIQQCSSNQEGTQFYTLRIGCDQLWLCASLVLNHEKKGCRYVRVHRYAEWGANLQSNNVHIRSCAIISHNFWRSPQVHQTIYFGPMSFGVSCVYLSRGNSRGQACLIRLPGGDPRA